MSPGARFVDTLSGSSLLNGVTWTATGTGGATGFAASGTGTLVNGEFTVSDGQTRG